MTEMTEMTEDAQQEAQLLRAEVARLQKIIKVLMDKAERSASLYDTDFNLFQTTITLEKQVQQRTAELEAALHENERVTRALRESESQVRQLAFYDALTSLANRRLLHDRLTEALLACKRHRHHGALLFLDLDHFKPLNDAHGHEAGDLLLVEAANRLKGCVRAIDTVARMGGDEFVVLIAPLAPELPVAEAQAMTVAEKIRAALALPYRLHLHGDDPASVVEHHCTSSIGVTLFDEHTLEDDALQRADEAMYRAKEEGRNRVSFSMATPQRCRK